MIRNEERPAQRGDAAEVSSSGHHAVSGLLPKAPAKLARVIWLDFRARRSDEAFGVLERVVVRPLEQLPSCRSVVLLRDPKTGNATLMTLWTDRRDMERFGGLNDAHMSKLYDLLAGTPAEEVYEVREASL